MTKTCAKCGVEKRLAEFFPRGDRRGFRSRCKECSKRSEAHRERRREIRDSAPERAIRDGMIQRCHNPKNPSYSNYGGRGIIVCDDWLGSYENFVQDMGRRPSPKHTLERIDNDGPYSRENCRWATRAEQNRNTRQNVVLTIGGVSRCRAEWAAKYGVRDGLIRDRMDRLGWDAERAVTTPVRARSASRRAA